MGPRRVASPGFWVQVFEVFGVQGLGLQGSGGKGVWFCGLRKFDQNTQKLNLAKVGQRAGQSRFGQSRPRLAGMGRTECVWAIHAPLIEICFGNTQSSTCTKLCQVNFASVPSWCKIINSARTDTNLSQKVM